MQSFDTQALIAEVAARHGVLLKPNDAAFALVTMNQIVVEHALKLAGEEIDGRIKAFDQSIQKIERLAGKMLAQEVKNSAATARGEIQSDLDAARLKVRELMEEVTEESRRWMSAKWWAFGLATALVIFVCGFALGRANPSMP